MSKQTLKESLINLRATALHALLIKNNIQSNYIEVYNMAKNKNDESTYYYFKKRDKRIHYLLLYIFLFLFTLIGLITLSYYYKDYVIMFFDRMDINTFYLIKLFNFIKNSILYISDTYNLLILKLKLFSNY